MKKINHNIFSQHSEDNSQAGVIAIFMAVVISILLVTSTTLASRVTVTELSQSSAVDRSEQAYYAAEAGIEEAARRIDINPNGQAKLLFPQQYDGTGVLVGDALQITGDTGLEYPNGLTPAVDSGLAADYGQTSWRSRRVFEQGSTFSGFQVKDETVQFDASELCRRVATTVYGTATCAPTGAVDKDSDGSDIYSKFNGLKYCWTSNGGTPAQIELTDTYYAKAGLNTANPVATEKAIIAPTFSGTIGRANNMIVSIGPGPAGGQRCLQFTSNVGFNNFANYRYIFRIKALFNTGVTQTSSLSYEANLIENPVPATQSLGLYIPNNSFLIDVVGQSGDIKRRVVARKLRSGRLIGIFDYVLYTGSTANPLCKNGVDQLEASYGINCISGAPIDNN
ncbi:MAG: hypothetical protein ABIS59_01145 [Candidatus Saccharibacteria bacterium]